MSTRAHRIYRHYRYRPAPIGATFVPCHRDVHSCLRCGRKIWPGRYAADYPDDGFAWITGRVVTACHPATIQIPIVLRTNPATAQRPAVSSPEACPTPAI